MSAFLCINDVVVLGCGGGHRVGSTWSKFMPELSEKVREHRYYRQYIIGCQSRVCYHFVTFSTFQFLPSPSLSSLFNRFYTVQAPASVNLSGSLPWS
jgi:hypothetical protein